MIQDSNHGGQCVAPHLPALVPTLVPLSIHPSSHARRIDTLAWMDICTISECKVATLCSDGVYIYTLPQLQVPQWTLAQTPGLDAQMHLTEHVCLSVERGRLYFDAETSSVLLASNLGLVQVCIHESGEESSVRVLVSEE